MVHPNSCDVTVLRLRIWDLSLVRALVHILIVGSFRSLSLRRFGTKSIVRAENAQSFIRIIIIISIISYRGPKQNHTKETMQQDPQLLADAVDNVERGGDQEQQQEQQEQGQEEEQQEQQEQQMRSYTGLADKLQQLWALPRRKAPQELLGLLAKDLDASDPAVNISRLLAEFELPASVEWALLNRWMEACVDGTASPTIGDVEFLEVEAAALIGVESPNVLIVQLIGTLLQEGFTHITLPTVVDRTFREPIPLSQFTRELLSAARNDTHAGLWRRQRGDVQVTTYLGLVDLLQYFVDPIEAKLSVQHLLDDLDFTKRSPLSSEICAVAWIAISNLMAYPPQEDEPEPTGAERERPRMVVDPNTGYEINRGDAHARGSEYATPVSEAHSTFTTP